MISVIVPVYNCITTLERCVQAILEQTMQDWELILVDDGATDGSGELCDRLAARDARIRVLHKPNGGVSSARNLGLDKARGEFVMFCDSDDWAEPQWCEKLYQAAKENPDCQPICNYYRNTPSGQTINTAAAEFQIPREAFFALNRQELLGIPWNKIFRRQIIEEQRIRFCPELSLGEDLIFNLDYFHHIPGGLLFINMPLYHYSLGNTDSLSARYYPDLAELYRVIYGHVREEMARIPDAWEKWEQEYQRSYFFAFDRVFRNTWSAKNPASLLRKWRYNATAFHSKDFQSARHVMLKHPMNALQRLGLRSNCFILYWLTVSVSERLSRLRHKRDCKCESRVDTKT